MITTKKRSAYTRSTGTALKALALLDIIAAAEAPLRFKDLAVASGLTKPTLHRMLKSLLDTGYVRLRASDQTYAIGLKVLELARHLRPDNDLRTAAQPVLTELSTATGEAAHLALLDGLEVLYASEHRASDAIRTYYASERRVPIHCSSVGKAILAFLDPGTAADLIGRLPLTQYTKTTISTADTLTSEISLVRARGYAIDNEELEAGVRCVAAPIVDGRGDVLSAIGITGPAFRLPLERCHEIGAELMAAAGRISARLQARLHASRPSIPKIPREAGRSDITCVQPSTAFLGDSPLWDADRSILWWVDILGPTLHRFDPSKRTGTSLPLTGLVSALALTSEGGLVAATETGFAHLDTKDGSLRQIGDLQVRKAGVRFNDGKCDRAGRFWAGTMSMIGEAAAGALYRLDPDGQATLIEEGFGTINGIGWSPDDRTVYVTDSLHRVIYAYDFSKAAGTISRKRRFAEVSEDRGMPGGLTVDADGYVWSAHWDGWCVTRYAPDGQIDRVVTLPVPRPMSCMFGGPGLKTIFVTTARIRLTSAQLTQAPLSGSVFSFDAPVTGVKEPQMKLSFI